MKTKVEYRIFNHFKGLDNSSHVEIGFPLPNITRVREVIKNLDKSISKENLRVVREATIIDKWDITDLI